MTSRFRSSWLAALAAVLHPPLHAADAGANVDQRAFNAAWQRDAQGNTTSAVSLSLPVGQRAWAQAGLGQSTVSGSTSAQQTRSRQASLGAGWVLEQWQFGLGVDQRRERDGLRQDNVSASADLRFGTQGSLGMDTTWRDIRAQSAGAGAASPSTQRLTGRRIGLRAALAVTERVTVYGAAQATRFAGTGDASNTASGGGPLGGLLPAQGLVTVVNRDEAALTQGLLLGVRTQLNDRLSLSAEVARDRLLGGGTLHNLQLRAATVVGDSRWTLTPGVGFSRSASGSSVASGLLQARYAW